MTKTLTLAQRTLLRRCDGGLRLWEVGAERAALLVELNLLSHLRLVSLDESLGWDLTSDGEAWLVDEGR
jgi:hypothetical protein